MKSVRLVIPDLFLPKDISAEVCADLRLPALEKILSRGRSEILPQKPLENHLCELFDVPLQLDVPVAPISAAFDGLPEGCWLRADPVHLNMQRDQLLLSRVLPDNTEAVEFCMSLNAHFSDQGMTFFAPHPQRWYVRLATMPNIYTMSLSAVMGANVRDALPTGVDAVRWHQLFNEIQMLLFEHPFNQAREARGELPVNSIWLWGGGYSMSLACENYDWVSSDEVLPEMLAMAAGVPFAAWSKQWDEAGRDGRQLLVWTGLSSALQDGDLASWRKALQEFEVGYAQPLWQALGAGKLAQLQLDIMSESDMKCLRLKRGDTWAFWRRVRHLEKYSLV